MGVGGWWGVQRKEAKDFLASVHDGRLAKEFLQMKRLHQGVLLLEGSWRWTSSGELFQTYGFRWTRSSHRGYLWSVRQAGVWVEATDGLSQTVELVPHLATWSNKTEHGSITRRASAPASWGAASNRDYQLWILQSLPGVGPKVAAAILDTLGMPLAWTVGELELMSVPGVGKKMARSILAALTPTSPTTRGTDTSPAPSADAGH